MCSKGVGVSHTMTLHTRLCPWSVLLKLSCIPKYGERLTYNMHWLVRHRKSKSQNGDNDNNSCVHGASSNPSECILALSIL